MFHSPTTREWYSLISKSFVYTLIGCTDFQHIYTFTIYCHGHPFHIEFYLSTLRSNIIYWVKSSELIEHWPIPNLNLFMWTKSFRNRNFTKKYTEKKQQHQQQQQHKPVSPILMVILFEWCVVKNLSIRLKLNALLRLLPFVFYILNGAWLKLAKYNLSLSHLTAYRFHCALARLRCTQHG